MIGKWNLEIYTGRSFPAASFVDKQHGRSADYRPSYSSSSCADYLLLREGGTPKSGILMLDEQMELLDVQIEIAHGSEWRIRNQRIERLKSAPIPRIQVNGSSSSSPANSGEQALTSPTPEGNGSGNDKFMDAELYRAATKNDVDGFIGFLERLSIEKGLCFLEIFRQISPLGNTLLHIAASHGNDETVRLIAYHSSSLILQQNARGDTALHLAARAGHVSAVRTLLRFRKDWVDPLASEEWIEELRAIPDDQKLLRIRNGKGNTALHEALMKKNSDATSLLINEDPEVAYYENCEGKSPLFLAAEAGNGRHLSDMLEDSAKINDKHERIQGKSPLHAAISMRDKGLIDIILEAEPRFINLLDEEGMSPLHFAASINYVEGVRYLLSKGASSPMERSRNGLLPIHLAAIKGHIQVTQELLHHYPDPREMLDHNGQNILHAAAKSGKYNLVKYILKTPELECLINEENCDGNTPLHLATINWHPKTVNTMTWDQRVDLNVKNNEGLTAFDAAEYYMEGFPTFRKRLTWTALKAAGAAQPPRIEATREYMEDTNQPEPSNADSYKERVNTLLLVATLVATVTFAAGFTMPGGYNNSNPDQGMATMLRDNVFPVFALCDTIAMCSSVIVVVTLIWAQLGDVNLVFNALRLALPLLGVSLTMMSLAFMAGLYLVVRKLTWLACAIFIMGVVFLIVLLAWFFPLCFPVTSSNRFLRYISYYPFQLLIFLAFGNQGTS
ncbi:hypothetical protein Nepgr_000425 [Nepenthes gracilis]|uniref:PGG domain-containing protein n=1 Tax=Nepenthes gracilis TaxID=150966 RepID=A0AAD3P316_NEPGR|nr:hypothetical protein Nepgr_000425 [Nepenthes gracilis]